MLRFSRAAIAAFALTATAGVASAQVIQYSFDEGTGTTATNSGSAASAAGQLVGGAAFSTNTPSGTGFSLDLTNDAPYAHLLSGDVSEVDALSDFTLTTWLDLEQYTSGNARLISKQAASTFNGLSWNLNSSTNDGASSPDDFRMGLFVGGTNGFNFVFSGVDAGASDWTFLAVTYDSTAGTATFYIGDTDTGVSMLGAPLTFATNPGPLANSDAALGVGFTAAAPTADTSAIGFQDDVRIYSGVLDAQALDAVRLENIPEPTSLAALGGLGLLALRRRRA